jgi:hypothetical protein
LEITATIRADSEFRRSTQRGLHLEGLLQRRQISKFFR